MILFTMPIFGCRLTSSWVTLTGSCVKRTQRWANCCIENVPNLVGGRWPTPEIWGFKLAKNGHFTPFGHKFAVYCAKLMSSIKACFGAKMKLGGLYHRAKFGRGRLTSARDMGVQTCENRHFTFLGHSFVVYCAKVIRSISRCFGAKM